MGSSSVRPGSVLKFFFLKGCLAQLVQSICLTSRGSGVRIPQHPRDNKAACHKAGRFCFFITGRFGLEICGVGEPAGVSNLFPFLSCYIRCCGFLRLTCGVIVPVRHCLLPVLLRSPSVYVQNPQSFAMGTLSSRRLFCLSLVEPQCFTFPAVKTCVLLTALRPPFSIFSEERIRHVLVSGEIFAFALPLLTPFSIFVSRR